MEFDNEQEQECVPPSKEYIPEELHARRSFNFNDDCLSDTELHLECYENTEHSYLTLPSSRHSSQTGDCDSETDPASSSVPPPASTAWKLQ